MYYSRKKAGRFSICLSKDIKRNVANIIILIYWMMTTLYYVVGLNGDIYYYGRIVLNILALLVLFSKKKDSSEKKVMLKEIAFIFFMLLMGLVSSTYNQNATYLGYMYNMLATVGIAILLSHFQLYRWIPKILLFVFVCLLLQYYLTHGRDLYYFLLPGGQSRNYISIMVITYAALYYIAHRSDRGKGMYLISGIVFLVCLMAVGRGGIMAGAVLMIFSIWIWCIQSRKMSNLVAKFMFAFFLLVIAFLFILSLGVLDRLLGNFTVAGIQTSRIAYLWVPYLEEMNNIPNLLFGAYYIKMVGRYEHLHNSYLMLHARFGLIFLLVLMFMLIVSFRKLWRENDFILAAILFVIMQRAFTDSMLGFSYCDVVLLYFVFINFENKKKPVTQDGGQEE